MKKISLILVVFVFVAFAASAQEKGQIRGGASLAIGTKSGISNTGGNKLGLGVNIGGDYFVTDVIAVSPSFTLFLPTDGGGGWKYSLNEINIDGKYFFMTDGIKAYGLAGLSRIGSKITSDVSGFSFEATGSKIGLNIGAGAEMGFSDALSAVAQVKYNTPAEQIVLNLGVVMSF